MPGSLGPLPVAVDALGLVGARELDDLDLGPPDPYQQVAPPGTEVAPEVLHSLPEERGPSWPRLEGAWRCRPSNRAEPSRVEAEGVQDTRVLPVRHAEWFMIQEPQVRALEPDQAGGALLGGGVRRR